VKRAAFVHVYTGAGKGKTTAAVGLILRARGAGLRVYLGQFLKRGDGAEVALLRERCPEVTVEAYGRGRFIRGRPTDRDVEAARDGLRRLREALHGGQYDLVVADEACPAARAGLLPADALVELARGKPRSVELVFTGRSASARLCACADLVTEMRSRKHYFDRGIPARRGIEF
jgi:cob(I)alamin adenosyltransferase